MVYPVYPVNIKVITRTATINPSVILIILSMNMLSLPVNLLLYGIAGWSVIRYYPDRIEYLLVADPSETIEFIVSNIQ